MPAGAGEAASGRGTHRVALAAGLAAALVVAALSPFAWRQWEIRGAIAQLASQSGLDETDRAVRLLLSLDGPELRFQLDAFFGALEQGVIHGPWSLDADEADRMCALIRRLLAHDAGAVFRTRRPERNAFLYRALLDMGRADLACPEPREVLLPNLGKPDGCEPLDLEWVGPWCPEELITDQHLVLICNMEELTLTTMGAARLEVADLGPLPFATTAPLPAPPAEGDGAWRARPPPVVPGRAYGLRVRTPRFDLRATIVAVARTAKGLRLRWRIFEARHLEERRLEERRP